MMSLGMGLIRGDTTQSSTHDAQQTKTDSETDHDQFERKLMDRVPRRAGLLNVDPQRPGFKDAHRPTHTPIVTPRVSNPLD
jgi:hypothetical protein